MFGTQIVDNLKLEDFENYQDMGEGEGASPATIHMDISINKALINGAFGNGKVGGRIDPAAAMRSHVSRPIEIEIDVRD